MCICQFYLPQLYKYEKGPCCNDCYKPLQPTDLYTHILPTM